MQKPMLSWRFSFFFSQMEAENVNLVPVQTLEYDCSYCELQFVFDHDEM